MIFAEEFLREMNFKAGLIRKIEVARVNQPSEYFAITRKYEVEPTRFNSLASNRLRDIVDELTGA